MSTKENPKLLECLHGACNACIVAKFEEVQSGRPVEVQCPVRVLVYRSKDIERRIILIVIFMLIAIFMLFHTQKTQRCGTISKPDGIILNQFLIETSESSADDAKSAETEAKVIKCCNCDDTNATSWCVECAEYICDSCVQAHQRLKITKDHSIKAKEEAMLEDQPTTDEKTLMCQQHTQVSRLTTRADLQLSYQFHQLASLFSFFMAFSCVCCPFLPVCLFCLFVFSAFLIFLPFCLLCLFPFSAFRAFY